MSTKPALKPIPLLFLLLFFLLASCSDTTDPVVNERDGIGRIDPNVGTFLLKSVDVTLTDGQLVRLELVGSALELDDDGVHIDLAVAVRNAANIALPGPLTLWLGPFDPSSVFVANPDTSLPVGSIIPIDGFVYDAELGSDHILEPGETSAGKPWRFRTPAQESFSFGIRAVADSDPNKSVIAGTCFWDNNRNAVRDPDESPLTPGLVHVTAPDSTLTVIPVDRSGEYAYRPQLAGLYRLKFEPLFDTFAPLAYSTPNPRYVLITSDDDGVLRSFYEANFGAYTDIPALAPPIQFTETPLDSLRDMPWTPIGFEVVNSRILVCDVGYSGCGPAHLFSLWTNGDFMESLPVQVDLVLVHETEELCPAAWRREYPFDLNPLQDRFLESYGPGLLILNLIDFHGFKHEVTWEVGGPGLGVEAR